MEQEIKGRYIPINLNMSFVQKAPIRKILVLAEYGSIELDIIKNDLQFNNYKDNIYKKHNYPDFERNDMFKKQMIHFIDNLEKNIPPLTSLENVYDGHITALLIKKAIVSGSFIKLK